MRPVLRRVGVISSLMKSQPLQHVNDNRSISGYKSESGPAENQANGRRILLPSRRTGLRRNAGEKSC